MTKRNKHRARVNAYRKMLRKILQVSCDNAKKINLLARTQTKPPLQRNELYLTLSASLLQKNRAAEQVIADKISQNITAQIMDIFKQKYFRDAVLSNSSCGASFVVNLECVPH